MSNPFVKLLRPHQWSKNLLVFTPALFSGKATTEDWVGSVIAFAIISLSASAVYCFNDVHDAASDRLHPTKKNRPVASGAVAASQALSIALLLLLAAAGTALFVAPMEARTGLLRVMAAYLLLQIAYTFYAKKIPVVDLLALSSSFILRILFGVAVTHIAPSFWLLACTFFGALMLVLGKRYLEKGVSTSRAVLAAYSEGFLLRSMYLFGSCVVLTYFLWCHESVLSGRFTAPQILPTCLVVCFAMLRYFAAIENRTFAEDPSMGIILDPGLRFAAAAFVVYFAVMLY